MFFPLLVFFQQCIMAMSVLRSLSVASSDTAVTQSRSCATGQVRHAWVSGSNKELLFRQSFWGWVRLMRFINTAHKWVIVLRGHSNCQDRLVKKSAQFDINFDSLPLLEHHEVTPAVLASLSDTHRFKLIDLADEAWEKRSISVPWCWSSGSV